MGLSRRRAGVGLVALALLLGACAGSGDPGPVSSGGPAVEFGGPGDVAFENVSAASGILHVQNVNPEDECVFSPRGQRGSDSFLLVSCMIEIGAGGVAAFDWDGDGLLDLVFTRVGASPVLYRNLGSMRFEDVSTYAGLDALRHSQNGVAVADFDNDGFDDLFFSLVGFGDPFAVWFGGSGGRFEDRTALALGVIEGVSAPFGGTSVNVADLDGDGFLDVVTDEWLATPTDFGRRPLVRVFLNQGVAGPGVFRDVTDVFGSDRTMPPHELMPHWPPIGELRFVATFASAVADFDEDGTLDMFQAADFGQSQMFWGDGSQGGAFAPVSPMPSGDIHGMGLAVGDVSGDGLLDVFMTGISDEEGSCGGRPCPRYFGNQLLVNGGSRVFADVTDQAGVRDGGWAWGASMFDANNDGALDIVSAAGIDLTFFPLGEGARGHFVKDPPRLWVNDGAAGFSEVAESAGFVGLPPSSGVVTADLDADGLLDVAFVHPRNEPSIWRNSTVTDAGSIVVEARGRGASGQNPDGVGVRVTGVDGNGVQQVRVVGLGSHYLGTPVNEAHLAVVSGSLAKVVVEFPDGGDVFEFEDVARGTRLVVEQGAAR